MTKYILSLLMFMISYSINSYCQKTITIDKFETLSKEKFDGEQGGPITSDILTVSGFNLRLLKSVGLTKAAIKGLDGNFTDVLFPHPIQDAGDFFLYTEVKFREIPANGFVDIQIFKGSEFKVITLKVNIDAAKKEGDCDIHLVDSIKNCEQTTYDNNFGLTKADIGKKDIIYVYDFNPVLSETQHLKRFYKISLKRSGIFKSKDIIKSSKVNLTNEKLGPSKQVWIEIANVNRFMYDASIEDTLVDYNSEPSLLFNRMFLGDSSLLGTLITRFTDNVKIQSKGKENEDLLKDINCFNDMYRVLKDEMMKAYNPCATFSCCNSIDFNRIIKKLNQVNSDFSLYKLKAFAQKKDLDSLTKVQADCEEKKDIITKLTAEITRFEKITELKKEQKDSLKNSKAELDKYKDCTDASLINNRDDKVASTQSALEQLDLITQIQTQLPKEEDLRVISVFLMHVILENLNITRGPIQLKGNRLDFTLHINSIDSVVKRFGYPNFKDSLHYEIPILWKPFISFSSGSFIALRKNLQNKTYTWQESIGNNNTIDSSKYTLVESGYTLPPMGFSALGNIEWKASRSLGFGASLGVGLTIESSPKLAYLGGGSLFFGDLRQFAVTAGFAAMQVNKLANNFQSITDNQVIYTSKPNLDYNKEFKIGGFISLTYTPFKTSKSK